jgi:hypothetical protein
MAGFLFQAFEPEDRGILGMAYTSTDRHSVKAAILALAHGERVVCVHGFLGGNSGENLRENSAEGGGICTG